MRDGETLAEETDIGMDEGTSVLNAVSLDDVTCFATSSVSRTDNGSSHFELSVDIGIVKRSRGLLGLWALVRK